MDRRTAAGALAGGVGLTLAANRALEWYAGPLEPPLSGQQRTYRWRGFDVEYAEAGDPDDPDLVLLHGISAVGSSYEFGRVLDRFAGEYHVLAPDLPGFGRSARPDLRYSAALYIDFVRAFATRVGDRPACVANSLSGAYAAAAQAEAPGTGTVGDGAAEGGESEPGPFTGLVLVCPRASTVDRRRWLRALFDAPVAGETLYHLLTTKAAIRAVGERSYADPAAFTDEHATYLWRASHQPGARHAPTSFLSGDLDPGFAMTDVLGDLGVPATLAWGREAERTALDRGRGLADAVDAELVVFEESALLPHVEQPEAFAAVVDERHPRG